MIAVMIVVMGAAGMGYATPLNLGMAAFLITITPPILMLPRLIGLMGIPLPTSAMGQLSSALHGRHITPVVMKSLGSMLMSMHVPAATVSQMGLLMGGETTNSTMASLMSEMSPSVRPMVMSAMPVSAGQVAAGTTVHFAFPTFLGLAFAAVIGAAAWAGIPGMRTSGGIITAGAVGGAIVRAIMRWGLLPHLNPLMAFVPQTAFFLAHPLFGLVAGIVLAVGFRRPAVAGALPAR